MYKKIEEVMGKETLDNASYYLSMFSLEKEYHFFILKEPTIINLSPFSDDNITARSVIIRISKNAAYPIAAWDGRVSEKEMNEIVKFFAGRVKPTIIIAKSLPNNYSEIVKKIYNSYFEAKE